MFNGVSNVLQAPRNNPINNAPAPAALQVKPEMHSAAPQTQGSVSEQVKNSSIAQKLRAQVGDHSGHVVGNMGQFAAGVFDKTPIGSVSDLAKVYEPGSQFSDLPLTKSNVTLTVNHENELALQLPGNTIAEVAAKAATPLRDKAAHITTFFAVAGTNPQREAETNAHEYGEEAQLKAYLDTAPFN
ncbi:hypothetical protein [Collimonas humicola]|uniref:hypothetical protein n=1 Tax=Collimonas humicola TaxID=2825886 RepID=UPI001B8D95E5|nr:hypothetical protein [Collimonas humicola]